MKRFVKHECPGFATGWGANVQSYPIVSLVSVAVFLLIGHKLTKLPAKNGNYVVYLLIEPELGFSNLLMSKK